MKQNDVESKELFKGLILKESRAVQKQRSVNLNELNQSSKGDRQKTSVLRLPISRLS